MMNTRKKYEVAYTERYVWDSYFANITPFQGYELQCTLFDLHKNH